ncbi:MAG: S-layer homology domain-containing protein [Limnochordia bacterium]|jgi:hypothetical protein
MRRIYPVIIGCATVLLFAFGQLAGAAQDFKDLGGNWAIEHVMALADKGIVGGYPDGTFRPNGTVTRAELAKMIVKAFALPHASGKQDFRDTQQHWASDDIAAMGAAGLIDGYEDGAFRPEQEVNRAETIAIAMRALDINEVIEAEEIEDTAFSDVSATHWASRYITAADRLDILPPYYKGRLRPNEPVTRAEAAAIINGVLRLQVVEGEIDHADPARYVMSVKTAENALRDFTLAPSVTVYRNSTLSEADALEEGDAVYLVADRFGTPVFVKARGTATREEIASRASAIIKGLLTPDQITALIRRDWKAVANGFQVTLYNRLLEVGATPSEAEALMKQDWSSLGDMGQTRLAEALSDSLGVSQELVVALFDRDWQQVKELAQTEATELLLTQLLFGSDV